MPNPGQANNPGGVNGLYESEAPYGAIKRLEQQTKQAPLPPNPALNAPKRAQKKAGKQQEQVVAAPPPAAPPQMTAAQVWEQLAADPEAAAYPILLEYAQRSATAKPAV